MPIRMQMTDNQMWLNHLINNGPVELRCFKDDNGNKKILSGVYNNLAVMLRSIEFAMGEGYDIYQTINPSNLFARNGVLMGYQSTTKNKDISRINTLFFDFDPVREKNTAATDDQIGDAYQEASRMIAFLKEAGFPEPLVLGFSGNGAHVYYACNLPVDDKPIIDKLYDLLKKRFDSEKVSFDTSVRNLARIARTFGTINNKAGRKSACEYSNESGFVSREVLIDVANKFTPPKTSPKHFVKAVGDRNKAGIRPNADILSKCASAGLNPVQTSEADKYWVKCFNSGQHSKIGGKDTVLWINPDGFYTYFCSHSHCSSIGSKELEEYLK